MTGPDGGRDRVTLRMGDRALALLERDVRAGIFANRSDAIRYIVRSYYDQTEFSGGVETEGELRGGYRGPLGPSVAVEGDGSP